jgi:hypothetical protein
MSSSPVPSSPPTNPLANTDLWTVIHEEAQRTLASLDRDVRNQLPDVEIKPGRTRGTSFLLCTYRTYSLPGSTVDPVVLGITFQPAPGGVAVAADLSGEATGDVIFSPPARIVPQSREALVAAVQTSAQEFRPSAAAIAAALTNPTRQVD